METPDFAPATFRAVSLGSSEYARPRIFIQPSHKFVASAGAKMLSKGFELPCRTALCRFSDMSFRED